MTIPSELIWGTISGLVTFVFLEVTRILYLYIKYRRPFERVWGFYPHSIIHVVTGNIMDKNYKYLMSFGDIHAFAEVMNALKTNYRKSEIKPAFSGDLRPDLWDEPMVSIGGPAYNLVTREVLDLLGSQIILPGGGKLIDNRIKAKPNIYVSREPTVLKPGQDYGVVIRCINPKDPQGRSNLILIAGIRTAGVLGAAKCLSTTDKTGKFTIPKLNKHLKGRKSFSFIVKVTVYKNGIATPEVLWKTLRAR